MARWERSMKVASPVASASSIMRMDGSAAREIANFSRDPIPEEYVFMGRSIASPSAESSTTPSNTSSVWSGVRPMASAPSFTFCAPVSSGMSAALTPSRTGRELVSTVPELGASSPARVRSSVDFPEPFRPMIPMNSPDRATKETPRRAETTTFCFFSNLLRTLERGVRSVRSTLYRIRRLWATTVSGESAGAIQRWSAFPAFYGPAAWSVFGSLSTAIARLPSPEEEEAEQQQPERPGTEDQPGFERRHTAVHEDLPVHGDHLVDGVELHDHVDHRVFQEPLDRKDHP